MFNLQSDTVSNSIARTFVEVGGNVQVLRHGGRLRALFTLIIGDVQPTARGGAVILTAGRSGPCH